MATMLAGDDDIASGRRNFQASLAMARMKRSIFFAAPMTEARQDGAKPRVRRWRNGHGHGRRLSVVAKHD